MKNLESFTIHQFRGLRELQLKDLGRINLIVGVNNSGKTSVLEAISIYCHPRDIKFWLSTARQREQESRILRTPIIETLQWLFSLSPDSLKERLQTGKISISSNGAFFVNQLEAEYNTIEETILARRSSNSTLLDEPLIEDDSEIEIDIDTAENRKGLDFKIKIESSPGQLPLFNDPSILTADFQLWEDEYSVKLSNPSIPSLSTASVTISSHRSENQVRLFSESRFKNLKPDILKLLCPIDNNINDIEILVPPDSPVPRFNIYIQHQQLGLVPISMFGDGVRRLLHIGLKLASLKEGGILLIDELGSAIHTEALQDSFRWLVNWCHQKNVQLFATTHSLEVVDTLLDVTDSESDLAFYRIAPKEAKTGVVRHDWERLKRLRQELGQEVRW